MSGQFLSVIKRCCSKVPSGQIGSASEWYHWKGLEEDISRYRFLIFDFGFEELKDFKVLSLFIQKCI
jgi:hypothetical protein